MSEYDQGKGEFEVCESACIEILVQYTNHHHQPSYLIKQYVLVHSTFLHKKPVNPSPFTPHSPLHTAHILAS
jgi:hypothetical protein